MGSDDDIWIMEWDFTIIIVFNMFTAPPLFLSLPGIQLALPQCLKIVKGEYKFIYDLLSLEACSPQRKPLSWPRCHTPINTQYLMLTLARHPDPRFVGFIYRGHTEGFRIGLITGRLSTGGLGKIYPRLWSTLVWWPLGSQQSWRRADLSALWPNTLLTSCTVAPLVWCPSPTK